MTGPNADRWRCDLAGELVLRPRRAPWSPRWATRSSCWSLLPGTGDDPDDAAPAAHRFAATIRAAQPVVESDRSRVRLTVGVSGPAESVTALPGALHEAGSARRLAAAARAPRPSRS